jgi:hypothetical protein
VTHARGCNFVENPKPLILILEVILVKTSNAKGRKRVEQQQHEVIEREVLKESRLGS